MYYLVAIFKGEDGSLGYKTGEIYELYENVRTYQNCPVTIMRLDYTGFCPYGSHQKFLENWAIIKRVPLESMGMQGSIIKLKIAIDDFIKAVWKAIKS